MWTPCPFPVHRERRLRGPALAQAPRLEEDSHQGLHHPASHAYVLILSRIMQILHLPQPFPRSPHVGVLFFFLLFATSCVPKSQVRLTPMMLTDSQRACAARPVWRWARGAITFRLYLLAPGLPRPSPPLPDQPWLLSGTRGSLSHERHHSVPPTQGAVSPPGL